jgi:uncharacterized protein involved in exopolysaccharide biosynthesis
MSDHNFEAEEIAAGLWSHTGDHPDQIPLLQARIKELEAKLAECNTTISRLNEHIELLEL